jgi:hypothetical protein
MHIPALLRSGTFRRDEGYKGAKTTLPMRTLSFRTWPLLLILLAGPVSAQDTGLSVSGRITDGDHKLAGCEVITYLANERLGAVSTDKNGRFEVHVPLNGEYALELRKEGFISKRIVVDTRSDAKPEELVLAPLVMDVSLLPTDRYEGANTDELDFPFAIVRYDKGQHTFAQDMEYTMGMQRTNGAILLMAARAEKRGK